MRMQSAPQENRLSDMSLYCQSVIELVSGSSPRAGARLRGKGRMQVPPSRIAESAQGAKSTDQRLRLQSRCRTVTAGLIRRQGDIQLLRYPRRLLDRLPDANEIAAGLPRLHWLIVREVSANHVFGRMPEAMPAMQPPSTVAGNGERKVDLGEFVFRADDTEADDARSEFAGDKQLNLIIAETKTAAKMLIRNLLHFLHG